MTRTLLAASLLLLSACATQGGGSYRQAAAVQAAPTPQPAPSFPTPGFTPAGAGASHGMLPAPQRKLAPYSPNKRVLPASGEAGVWAADGATRASVVPPPLFGVTLPYPSWATEAETRFWPDACVVAMHNSSVTTGMYNTIMREPEDVRACMAARALKICAMGFANKSDPATQEGAMFRQLEAHADALVERLCLGAGWTVDHGRVLLLASGDWIKAASQYAKDHQKH